MRNYFLRTGIEILHETVEELNFEKENIFSKTSNGKLKCDPK